MVILNNNLVLELFFFSFLFFFANNDIVETLPSGVNISLFWMTLLCSVLQITCGIFR